jgi:hypothetical protein
MRGRSNVVELILPTDASKIGDAGDAVGSGVRRLVDDSDDEDGVGKGGRRFKQAAGTPNLHLVHSFPCLAHTQRAQPAFLPF